MTEKWRQGSPDSLGAEEKPRVEATGKQPLWRCWPGPAPSSRAWPGAWSSYPRTPTPPCPLSGTIITLFTFAACLGTNALYFEAICLFKRNNLSSEKLSFHRMWVCSQLGRKPLAQLSHPWTSGHSKEPDWIPLPFLCTFIAPNDFSSLLATSVELLPTWEIGNWKPKHIC